MRAWVLTRDDAAILARRVSHLLPLLDSPRTTRRPVWAIQGSRDHRATPPAPGPSPPDRPVNHHRRRPDDARRDRHCAPPPPPPGLDRDSRDAAALAPPPNRTALDSATSATPGKTANACSAPPTGGDAREAEPDMGTSAHPRRTRRPRPRHRVVDGLEDPQGQQHRASPATLGGDLERVPALPSRRRNRLLHRRHRHVAPLLRPLLHRHRDPQGVLCGRHGEPDRSADNPGRPQPLPAPQRTTLRCPRPRA